MRPLELSRVLYRLRIFLRELFPEPLLPCRNPKIQNAGIEGLHESGE